MTHQPANRPRIAATYASGTVRARRWHGDDVRGYRPPRGWTARADLTDLHPSRAAPAARVWWIIETRNNEPHRPQSRAALGPVVETPGAAVAAPGFLLKAKTPHRRLRTGGDGEPQGRSCAKSTKPAAWRRIAPPTIRRAPPQWRGWCGYAPACCGRLHESVPSPTLAVRCLYVTKDGSPTRRPASLLWSFHTTPQYVAVSCGRGALACRRGIDLARVRAQAGAAVTRGCRVGHVSIRERAACASLSCCESWRWRGCALC